MLAPVLNVTVNNVLKRVAATSGAANAFAPEKIDPTFQQRLLAVTMTPGNLAALSDQIRNAMLEADQVTTHHKSDNGQRAHEPRLG